MPGSKAPLSSTSRSEISLVGLMFGESIYMTTQKQDSPKPQHSQDSPQGCWIGLGLMMEVVLEVVLPGILAEVFERFKLCKWLRKMHRGNWFDWRIRGGCRLFVRFVVRVEEGRRAWARTDFKCEGREPRSFGRASFQVGGRDADRIFS